MEPGRGRARCALWGGVSLGVGTLAYAFFSSSSAGCATNLVVLTRGTLTARGCAAYSVVSHIGVGLIVLGAVLLLGSFALALRARRMVTAGATAERFAPEGSTSAVSPASGTVPAAPSTAATAPTPPPPPRLPPPPPRLPPPPPRLPLAPVPAPTPGPTTQVAPVPAPTPGPTTQVAPVPAPTQTPAWIPTPTADPTPAVPVARRAETVPPPATPPRTPIAPGDDAEEPSGLLASAIRLPPGWYGNPNQPGKPVQWWDGTKLTDRPE